MIKKIMKPYLYVSKVYYNQREPILFHLKKHQLQKDTTLIKPYVKSFNKQYINEHRMFSFKISYLSIDLFKSNVIWMNIK